MTQPNSILPLPNLDTVEKFINFIGSPKVTVVHFYADWADQCATITAVLRELTRQPVVQTNGTTIALCDAEKLSEISLKYKVDSVPTVLLFKNGDLLDSVEGADAPQITQKVKTHSARAAPFDPVKKRLLLDRLKALVKRHRVMAFIKGTRNEPKCGFTRTLIQILNSTGVEYDTFDILSDEEVRQGLKEYADWPTYPQVFVKGELVGGLDIVKELQTMGQLANTLNC